MTITTADTLPLGELASLWNRGFQGYIVDVAMTPDRLAAHIRRSGVDLSLSPVLLLDGVPVGFSCAAIGDRDAERAAWIGGFGIDADHRRQGLAGQLLLAQLDLLDRAGITATWLEVIDTNPARRVYTAGGFREVRVLDSFEGVPRPVRDPVSSAVLHLDPARLDGLHRHLHGAAGPVWRRRLDCLHRVCGEEAAVELLAVPAGDSFAAYALCLPGTDRVSVLDAAVADREAADHLLSGLARLWSGRPLRLIDEPEDSPLGRAMAEGGLRRLLRQFEMVRVP